MFLCTLWILAVLIIGLVAFCQTHNPVYLSIFTTVTAAAFHMRWVAGHVVPMDERTYQLKKLKVEMRMQNRNKKRTP